MQTGELSRWRDPFIGRFLRLAAGGWIPAGWFQPPLPPPEKRTAQRGRLRLEIVSHCWQYAHFLLYQLSSLAKFPPSALSVTMTVYYNKADARTVELLEFFGEMAVPGVEWNWRELPAEKLFRRAIGRNERALASWADWIWFTDCDLLFREGCLDALSEALQGRRDSLVYPRTERVTPLLPDENPLLSPRSKELRVVDVDPHSFFEMNRGRATGPLQITHGDVARAAGYCNALSYYQRPSPVWAKAYEDRAFRWLLGSPGVPLEIPGVYRIRHQSKGRYKPGTFNARLRAALRRGISRLRERGPDSAGADPSAN